MVELELCPKKRDSFTGSLPEMRQGYLLAQTAPQHLAVLFLWSAASGEKRSETIVAMLWHPQ